MAGRLPHDAELEASVLGGILLNNDALLQVQSLVEPDDFFDPRHRAIYEAALRLQEAGHPIDPMTLERALAASGDLGKVGGIEGIGRLLSRYTGAHAVERYAKILHDLGRVRKMVQICAEIADEGQQAGIDALGQFVDEAERRVLEVGQSGRHSQVRPMREIVVERFQAMQERADLPSSITGVRTGYAKLDEMTGGLQPGDLVILAARPSMGKTALALNICQNVCMSRRDGSQPLPVLFFSLEMSAEQLVDRLLCAEARVDASRYRRGTLSKTEGARLVEAGARLSKARLWVDDSAAPTILDIRARARRFRQDRTLFPEPGDGEDGVPRYNRPLGLIVVDYLQLCRGSRARYDSREQEISEISRGLKAIAKELDLPVVALSQLNRSVDSRADHRPQLSDLRESGAIEQDADVILFIYRPERYETDEEKRRAVAGKAEVIIGKQRNGPTGTVHLVFFGEHTRFENPAEFEGAGPV
ncbi:MAG: replicative DNA helicase [Deltaproteobacteria bacterium]|nr:MAG: replicative DNA helicase [Deltaproteobacteria bacterium]